MQLFFRRSDAWWTCVWKGEFQIPGRNAGPHRCRPGHTEPPAPQHPAGPSCPGAAVPEKAASTSPHTPSNPLCPPPRDEEPHGRRRLGTRPLAGALGLGSRRSHGPSRSRGTGLQPRGALGATKRGERGTPEPRARAALRARRRSAEGEEPRRCLAARAPRGAAPGPGRAPAAPRPSAPPPRQAARPAYRN